MDHHQEGRLNQYHDSVEIAISRIEAISKWYFKNYEIKVPNKSFVETPIIVTKPKLKGRKKTKVEDLISALIAR